MSTLATPMAERRELVFALVAPLGVKKDVVEGALRRALRDAGYTMLPIKISKWLESNESWLLGQQKAGTTRRSSLARKKDLMDAGDDLREKWDSVSGGRGRGDAGAFVAIMEMWASRAQINEGIDDGEQPPSLIPLSDHAFLIDSLKHPDELDRLRRVYGPAFVSIGVYSPRENRRDALELELQADEDIALVGKLMLRDEDDVKLGQHVADAFYATDFIVDATRDNKKIRGDFRRLIELLFGDVQLTPEPDEYGMFLARAAQVRSGSLARQIGAAVLRDDGTIVSLGTNEVPKPLLGGQYWPKDDSRKGRDKDYVMPGHDGAVDTSDWWREQMLSDAIERLNEAVVLNECLWDRETSGRLHDLVYAEFAPLKNATIRRTIDYVRAVHAEAAAIIDAGRHGSSLLGTTMYTTTFPCHECGRHIVAAGVREVVYLEPYPKSGIRTLFADSIAVDPPERATDRVTFRTFVGVAPPRYLEFFTVGKRPRKTRGGIPIQFNLKAAAPELPYYTPASETIAATETTQTKPFSDFVKSQKENSLGKSPAKSKRNYQTDRKSDGKRAPVDVRRKQTKGSRRK